MNELLLAINDYLTAADIYDRTHTEQARQFRNRKRGVLNHLLVKYQRQADTEQQAALFAAQEAG